MSATLVLDRPMAFAQPAPKDRAKPQSADGRPAGEHGLTSEARRRARKRLLLGGIAILVLAGATIAPKVSGYLTEVLVDDNERVHQGQVLARIDPRDYEADPCLTEGERSGNFTNTLLKALGEKG